MFLNQFFKSGLFQIFKTYYDWFQCRQYFQVENKDILYADVNYILFYIVLTIMIDKENNNNNIENYIYVIFKIEITLTIITRIIITTLKTITTIGAQKLVGYHL